MKRLTVYVLTTCVLIGVLYQRDVASQIGAVKELAPDVYFHEGDLRGKGHCNNGWVIFDDYVLVIDANFPSGAQEIMPKIKAQTSKPIRFAFDTHHHGDHAYGNQVWVDNGAVPVAHENVVAEMRKYETGLFGGKPGRWESEAKAARGSQRHEAEGADAALSRPDDLRRRQAPRRAAVLRCRHTRTATASRGCRTRRSSSPATPP